MALRFEDWSGITPKQIIQETYQKKEWEYPQEGCSIIKVFPQIESDLELLQQWAQEHNLSIDVSRANRDPSNRFDWKRVHIDLYGPNIEYAPKEEILTSKEVWKQMKETRVRNNGKERF